MKQLLIKLAALFGLVPARRYYATARQLEEARSSAHSWKTRAGEALSRVKSLQAELKHHVQQVKNARAAADKVRNHHEDAVKLRAQLADTERELMLAREHLMAIEVKLDILEGAANVLDVRTRTAIRHEPTRTGVTR